MYSQIQTSARALLVFPLLLTLVACGSSGDGGAPAPTGTAQQASAGQASQAAGEKQNDAVYEQLTAKLNIYEGHAGVNFLASTPLNLKTLREGKVTDSTTARRMLSSSLRQTNLTQNDLELRYGTWDETNNQTSTEPTDEIIVNYDNGIAVRFYNFAFTPTTNYVSSFKLRVTSPPGLANTADWVDMDLTVTLSDFNASGIPSTVRHTGLVSFWFDNPATFTSSVRAFNIDFRLTQDPSTLDMVVDLMVTDPTTDAFWHSVMGETYSQPTSNVDRFTITVNYNDSNTMVYALTLITDFESVNGSPGKITMVGSGGAYFQGAQIGILSGGPLVFDYATGVMTGLPIMMTWTDGNMTFFFD